MNDEVNYLHGPCIKDEAWLMYHILRLFPNGQQGMDNDGQVVIYTNMSMSKEGTLREMEDVE